WSAVQINSIPPRQPTSQRVIPLGLSASGGPVGVVSRRTLSTLKEPTIIEASVADNITGHCGGGHPVLERTSTPTSPGARRVQCRRRSLHAGLRVTCW